MKDRKRDRSFDTELNPNDHYDAERGTGKDPHISGPRSDEADLDQMGEDHAAPHDGYHLARAGRWDPYAVEPDEIDDH